MARRGRRSLIALLVVLMLLVGLFVLADRVAAGIADRRLAAQAQTAMANRQITSEQAPTAKIHGFPFLTQVLAGTYQEVTIDLDHPRTPKATLEHLTIDADTVHAPLDTIRSGNGRITADAVQGTATMTWDEARTLLDTTPLSRVPGLDVSKLNVSVNNDNVVMSAPVAFGPLAFTLRATGTLAVASGQVRVRISDLAVTGANGSTSQVPKSFIDRYKSAFDIGLAVPSLPYSLVINKVTTSGSGVLVTATASNVVLSGQS